MNIQQSLAKVIDGKDLSRTEMRSTMQAMMTGACSDAQIGGLLIALRMKGESIDEIAAAAEVMLSLAEPVSVNANPLIDIVGTGGDGIKTFNVSTAASFVAAGAGAFVAKHGNRSVSSSSGSADVLEQLGANIDLPATQVASVIERAGVGFMFAPMYHSAMRHAIGPRKEMAVRTLFNVLGPLTNPARVTRQLVGVFDDQLRSTLARVLGSLGSEHALVVRGEDGMDEISICAPTRICEYKNGALSEYRLRAEDVGLERGQVSELVVASAQESMQLMLPVLQGKPGVPRDIVVINAGAALYVAGLADSIESGVQQAQNSIDQGKALTALTNYIDATQAVSKIRGHD